MERTLDWRPAHDPRSRDWPIRPLLAEQRRRPRSYTWPCRVVLDQGREGACVGFAWAHELAAAPAAERGVTDAVALEVYRRAQQLDPWPGEAYSGTSVLAGAKAVAERGGLVEYRWAFGAQDVIDTVGAYGPVVLGIPWHASMYNPVDGWLRLEGPVVGGHAILARGANPRRGYVVLHNSWGPGWGVNGTARIDLDDLAALLAQQGEACVPCKRGRSA